jgi:endonuclease/exonuclease/phosphatase (EEP) superfamily protein YafD
VGDAHAAAPHHLVIAAVAPVALTLAVAPPWGDRAARRNPRMLAALLTLAAPLCLLATTLLAQPQSV